MSASAAAVHNGLQAWVVEVRPRAGMPDPTGDKARTDLASAGIGCDAVASARIYAVAGPLDRDAVDRIAAELLTDPVAEESRVWPHADGAPGDVATPAHVLVMNRPGVMDPVEASVRRGIADLGLHAAVVRTGVRYAFANLATAASPAQVVGDVLANAVVDEIISGSQPRRPDPDPDVPAPASQTVPITALDADALLAVSKQGGLALNAEEMAVIQAHFRALGREPSDVELETLAQTWSEHCKHKTLTSGIQWEGESQPAYGNLLKDTVFKSTQELDRGYCLSVFADNAGVVRFDDTLGIAVKVETHNHPSAIEPYGGAGTGSGGVIRDILGTGRGARPVMCTDAFGVAPPDHGAELPDGVIHPRRVLRGVVSGVRDYGNRMGIPTAAGALLVHDHYLGSPLVFAGCVGTIPVDKVSNTGRDGIHGATFSSEATDATNTATNSTAVQIGNAIEERRVLEGLLRCRDAGYLRGLTDCGAGGFSSAIGELGEGTGADVELKHAPLKYAGLSAAEIWISEAQERMVLVVPPEHADAVIAVFTEEECEAVDVGTFTDTKHLVVRYDGEVVCDLSMEFLHDGLPTQVRAAVWNAPSHPAPAIAAAADETPTLLRMLSDWTVCSREWIVRQYDHEVQGGSALKPFVGVGADGPGDGAVIRPDLASRRAVALSHGVNPRYGEIDPYAMALCAIDEAMRNLAAMGGATETVALLDNFVWGDTKDPAVLGGIVRACEGCYDGAIAYGAPFVSGKDSLNNVYVAPDGSRYPVPPTLLITAFSVMDDVTTGVSSDLKRAGNLLYLVGETKEELGGSLYYKLHDALGTTVPRPDLERGPATYRAFGKATAGRLVRAAHDPSEGGLAVALAEMCIGGDCGAQVDATALPGAGDHPDAVLLFSESPSRIVAEVEPDRAAAFEAALAGLPVAKIGTVTDGSKLVVTGRAGTVIDAEVAAMRDAFRTPLYQVMGEEVPR
jgi:phosphoribosylformylglycinamidine synthase